MGKKRRLLKKGILSILLVSFLCPSTWVYGGTPSIYLDNSPLQFTRESGSPFADTHGRIQAPLRLTMEAFGCEVIWNGSNQTATLKKDHISVIVPVNQPHIWVDHKKQDIDTAAIIKENRIYLPLRAVVEAFGGTASWNGSQNAVFLNTNKNAPILTVHFLDVGQADSIFIDNGSVEVLIDGGNNENGTQVSQYISPYIDGSLDFIVATHPDADHIGGLDTVLKNYDVPKIIDSGVPNDTKSYRDYLSAAENEPNSRFLQDETLTFDLGNGVKLTMIETDGEKNNTNDNSVVVRLDYNNISALFTGDMSREMEEANLSRFGGKATVLKVAHHGSASSSSQAFLDEISPRYAIISAGKDNPYGHPHKRVLNRLFDMETIVYGTFRSGTIIMTTDGEKVSFNTTDLLTAKDAGDYDTAF